MQNDLHNARVDRIIRKFREKVCAGSLWSCHVDFQNEKKKNARNFTRPDRPAERWHTSRSSSPAASAAADSRSRCYV